MQRVKFKQGEQRKFLDLIIDRLSCVSLRGILQFGFKLKYSSLKNYYTERRHFSRDFFEDLCYLAKLNSRNFDVEYVDDNFGQVKGGKRSRRKGRRKGRRLKEG